MLWRPDVAGVKENEPIVTVHNGGFGTVPKKGPTVERAVIRSYRSSSFIVVLIVNFSLADNK